MTDLQLEPGWYQWRCSSSLSIPIFANLIRVNGDSTQTLLVRPRRSSQRFVYIDGFERLKYTQYGGLECEAKPESFFKKVSSISVFFRLCFRIKSIRDGVSSLSWPGVFKEIIAKSIYRKEQPWALVKRLYSESWVHLPHNDLAEAVQMIGCSAQFVAGPSIQQRNKKPLVSIIIPTKDQYELLSTCVDSILLNTSYENIEIIIVDNQSSCSKALSYQQRVFTENENIKLLLWPKLFNYSAINNYAVTQARGDILLFLNNDIEVKSANWLDEMINLAVQPDTGCVGASLFYPNGLVQHMGVALGICGVAGHLLRYFPADHPFVTLLLSKPRYVSAVTGACMAVKRSLFELVGGFDEKDLPIKYSDVDLCLKLYEQGFKNVLTPFAKLVHHESVSRGHTLASSSNKRPSRVEENVMLKRWKHMIDNDPYYSPEFTRLYEDMSLRAPSLP